MAGKQILEKLSILADAAKYDASCASSGTVKRDSTGTNGIGSTEGMGICHSYAPDGRWACYQFDDYRSLLRSDELAPWEMTVERGDARYILRVEPGIFPDTGSKLGLSAVIEELDGTKSYWALAHPPGKPDFHHPDCFALTLEAPGRA